MRSFSSTSVAAPALISDRSAIIQFDPPVNFRLAQVSNYEIKNIQTGELINATESPVIFKGLKNGVKYTFSVSATNSLGTSNAVNSNSIMPEAAWKSTTVDGASDAKYLATTIYAGKPVIAYSDSKNGDIKLATYSNSKWLIKTIDGNSNALGKTTNDVSGYVSICTSVTGKTNYLQIHLLQNNHNVYYQLHYTYNIV